ncbi:hypothetical protein IMZ48_09230 [Candidatus Bathyarchaeota archaeon]|nr:hypothetical protein [Candidatus Bathyarchaeota archaeon]
MDNRLTELIRYDPDWHVLICTRCKRCFRTSIAVHIRDFHKHLSYARQDLLAYEAGFHQNGYQLLTSTEQVYAIRPGPGTPPVKGLRLYRDGIAYLLCPDGPGRYVCRNESWMVAHARTVHHHRSPVAKGGNVKRKAVDAAS